MDKKLIIKDIRGWLNLLYHRVYNDLESDTYEDEELDEVFDGQTPSDVALYYIQSALNEMRAAFNSSKLADEIITNEKELENGISEIQL